MKKILALLLAMLMVLTTMSVALAQEDSDVVVVGDTEEPVVDETQPVAEEQPAVEDAVTTTEETVTETPVEEVVAEPVAAEQPVEEVVEVVEEVAESEEVIEGIADETVVEDAGITPDSPLWGIERAMERISLALTLGKSAKAQKGLAHAQERLMEVQSMIAQKKFDKAAKAQEAHDEEIQGVEEAIQEMEADTPEEELAEGAEVEKQLEEHKAAVKVLKNKIELKLNKLSPEQQAKVQEMIDGFVASNQGATTTVEAKKNKVKIKIMAKEGKTKQEVEAETEAEAETEETKSKGKVETKERTEAGNIKGSKERVETQEREESGQDSEEESEDESEESAPKGGKGKN